MERCIGKSRNNRRYQISEVFDSGAHISFGYDWPVTNEAPLRGVAVPVHRQEFAGADSCSPEQRITLLESHTVYALGVPYQEFFTMVFTLPEPVYEQSVAKGEWNIGQLLTQLLGIGEWLRYCLGGLRRNTRDKWRCCRMALLSD